MGIPVTPPPPRRKGETLDEYRTRCQPWLRLTKQAAQQSRESLHYGLLFVVCIFIFFVFIALLRFA